MKWNGSQNIGIKVHFVFFHPLFSDQQPACLVMMHQEDPGMEIAAKRAKFWGRTRFKVSNSTIHILERWNISWSWNIYILERWNTHILEHIYLGARIFISWSWNIHILERRNTHILEHLYLGARIFMLWSWTIHILDLEHSHFTAGTLGGEHLQSWE